MRQAATVLQFRSFSLPKKGSSVKEYEDACAWNARKGAFAIADGASESIYAGEWAELLAKEFVAEPTNIAHFGDWQTVVQSKWLAAVKKGPLPWYVEEKLRDGAFATFLGLKIGDAANGNDRTWRALAVGDSCLFQIDGKGLKCSFPISSADDFGTRPKLLGSRQRTPSQILEANGVIAVGDRLLLMTDAIAQWFLTETGAGRKPWHDLLQIKETDFPAWVDSLRQSERMKNDDVTLLVIDVEPAPR